MVNFAKKLAKTLTMADKLRNILSELATDVKAINADDRISFRYLYSKFKSKMEYFLRLEARSREILRDLTLWKPIDCLELIDVPLSSCGYIDKCKTLKRTEKKIPESYNTSYGQLIKVYTVDGRTEYTMIRSTEYDDYINREYISNKFAFWIEDNYIYIPNTELESIKVYLIPKDETEVDKVNGTANACSSPLDGTVNYPDYLITLAKQEVLKEISGVYKRVVEDERGDDNTNNK